MDRATVLDRLRRHEPELRALGLAGLSLFGSTARGDQRPDSDVDVAIRIDHSRSFDIFHYCGVGSRLEEILGVKVDMVSEPARKPVLQQQIDLDRVRVF